MKVRRLPPNTLCHYGVKGQRWGVITKEYEPVGTRSSGASDPRKNNNPVYNNSDPRRKGKVTTGTSKGVKRRGEGLGSTTPVGRQDKYMGRDSRFTEDYLTFARKNKVPLVSNCSSIDFQIDPNLKDHQISAKSSPGPDGYIQYSFTFKDEDTYNKWKSTMGLDDESLVERYNTYKAESNANTAYSDLEMWTAQTVNANMLMMAKYGTVTMKTDGMGDHPFSNFEEIKGDYNQLFPALDFFSVTDEEGNIKPEHQRKKKGYFTESNNRDKESGKMAETEAKIKRREFYKQEAAKSARRAEELKAYNKKLSTKVKRLGQSFKEVYSEGFNKVFKKKNLKHSDIYSNVRRLPSDTLCHSGIRGQRRGIRRFQYQNGTYTEAGNERYRPKSNKRKLTKENAEKTFYLGITATALATLAKIAIPASSSASTSLGSAAVASVLSGPVASVALPAAVISGTMVLADAIVNDLKKDK